MNHIEELTQSANLVLARCAACSAEEAEHDCRSCDYNAAQNLAYKVLEIATRPHAASDKIRKQL